MEPKGDRGEWMSAPSAGFDLALLFWYLSKTGVMCLMYVSNSDVFTLRIGTGTTGGMSTFVGFADDEGLFVGLLSTPEMAIDKEYDRRGQYRGSTDIVCDDGHS